MFGTLTLRAALFSSAIGVAVLAGFTAGCGSSPDVPTRSVSAGDFVDRNLDAPIARVDTARDPDPAPPVITSEQAREGLEPGALSVRIGAAQADPVIVEQPTDESPIDARVLASDAVLLDAKVGDINGRAVYASEVLRVLEPKFIRAAEAVQGDPSVSRSDWLNLARQDIALSLSEIIDSELLRAEALRSQPSEIRQYGLRNFVELVRQSQTRTRGAGSPTRARQGLTPDEYERQLERDLRLGAIQEFLLRPIRERTKITWPQVQAEYERRVAAQPTTTTAYFRGIRISQGDAAEVQRVTEQLEQGASFEQLAEQYSGSWFFDGPEDAPGGYSVVLEDSLEETAVFSGAELNGLAISLGPPGSGKPRQGGPVQSGSSVYWLYFERLDTPTATPLRDSQLAILQDLLTSAIQEEVDRYLARLKDSASSTAPEVMLERLMRIATARYLDPLVGPPDSSP